MGSVAKLRTAASPPAEPPPISPARQQLAVEIERARISDQRRNALKMAVESAKDAVFAAFEAVENSEHGVDKAKTAAVSYMLDVAAGAAGTAPTSIKAARTALVDAQDDLDAKTAVRDGLERQLEEAESWPNSDRGKLKEAALTVLRQDGRDIALRIVENVEKLQRDLVRAGSALNWLASAQVFAMDAEPGRGAYIADPRIHQARSRLESPPLSWHQLQRDQSLRADVEWSEVLDRLMVDPAAPLPNV